MNINELKKKFGFYGKSEQWQRGFLGMFDEANDHVRKLQAEVERLKSEYLVVNFGHGSIEVAEGVSENAYAMIFGNNGGGIVGQPLRGDRYMKKQETLAVLKFHSLSSVDVVLARLNSLRHRMANHEPVEIKNELGEVIEVVIPKLQEASK